MRAVALSSILAAGCSLSAAMKTAEFDYLLPPERIATEPARPRDSARLLYVREDGELRDRVVSDLPELLRSGDLLVLNDTRVIPARLRGRCGQAAVEVTLHKHEREGLWRAFARPARRLTAGRDVVFGDALAARVAGKGEGGEVLIDFGMPRESLLPLLDRIGRMPLPPYIKRPAQGFARDADDYQTVFARRAGAVAAPTAGLHFTASLLAALAARGISAATLTLHVGAGTFLPVRSDEVEKHRMHAEYGEIPPATAEIIAERKRAGGRIVAVGTTVLRLLESAAAATGQIHAWSGETDLFIVPGYPLRTADLLLTNFHLPRSTLLMLVAAFAGLARIKRAYAHAIAAGYRFYSYGDACLLERAHA
jgi:S-adenosylmethionine:tRNA ribosyltransferase-isomerase